jgi:hypothetical protein
MVLFVCTGNLCRSPSAEHLLAQRISEAGTPDVRIESAGTLGTTQKVPTQVAARSCCARLDLGAHIPVGSMLRRSSALTSSLQWRVPTCASSCSRSLLRSPRNSRFERLCEEEARSGSAAMLRTSTTGWSKSVRGDAIANCSVHAQPTSGLNLHSAPIAVAPRLTLKYPPISRRVFQCEFPSSN